ncbi:MAG: hypothetical protein AAGA17_15130 [Actinomycetota bacterium]
MTACPRGLAAVVAVIALGGCFGGGDDDPNAYCVQLDELRRLDQQLFEVDPTDGRETSLALDDFVEDLGRAVELAPEEIEDDVRALERWVIALSEARRLIPDTEDDLEAVGAYEEALAGLPDIEPAVARWRSHARRICDIEL